MHQAALIITADGDVQFVWDDGLAPLAELGEAVVIRASHVEPSAVGARWTADLSPLGGPTLGPYGLRGEALAAEAEWLRAYLGIGQQR